MLNIQLLAPMRVLLQDSKSLQYLTPDDTWTNKAALARNFGAASKAIAYAIQHRDLELNLVLKGRTEGNDFMWHIERRKF